MWLSGDFFFLPGIMTCWSFLFVSIVKKNGGSPWTKELQLCWSNFTVWNNKFLGMRAERYFSGTRDYYCSEQTRNGLWTCWHGLVFVRLVRPQFFFVLPLLNFNSNIYVSNFLPAVGQIYANDVLHLVNILCAYFCITAQYTAGRTVTTISKLYLKKKSIFIHPFPFAKWRQILHLSFYFAFYYWQSFETVGINFGRLR